MNSKQVPVNRVQIIHDSDSEKAGIIELRRECPEVSIGDREYGVVRFWLTDGTEIIGFALYSDDLSDEIDIRVNDLDYDYLVKNGSTKLKGYREVLDHRTGKTKVIEYDPQWNLFDWRSTPGSYIYYINYEKTAKAWATVGTVRDDGFISCEDVISFPAYMYHYDCSAKLKEYYGIIRLPVTRKVNSFAYQMARSGVFGVNGDINYFIVSDKDFTVSAKEGEIYRYNRTVWFKEPNLKAAVDVFVKSEREKAHEWALKIAKSQQIIDELNALVEEEEK